MAEAPFQTPILLIVFNRPETTRVVFESIRAMQPTKLFVAADGPRETVISDRARCEEVRRIATAVDWPCEVQTLFRQQNLGCGRGVSSAITWFFENVEEGIILEDDCLPSNSFYYFCQELLEYYRVNEQVMHISGNNFQYGRQRGTASYYFSRYTHNWGWATWRKSWRHFDLTLMPEPYRSHNWDKQWELSVEKREGISILPNANLVRNIGFGPSATHTKGVPKYAKLKAEEIVIPLLHPSTIKINEEADIFTEYTHFRNKSTKWYLLYNLWDKVLFRPKIIIKKIIDWKQPEIS